MGADRLQSLSPSESTLLGMAAGVGTKLINYPLLSWKCATQQGLPLAMTPSAVYRGLPMACINLGGSTGVQFLVTGLFQKALTNNGSTPLTQSKQIGAALLGGFFSGIPCSLWELTMIQQQRFGGSIVGVPTRLVKDHGARSLLRGVVMTAGRESLYTMAMLGLCPVMQSELERRFDMQPSVALGAGALTSAFVAATLTHPMDTIKTCMQGDVAQLKYKGIVQTGTTLTAEYGVAQGLFKGLGWRITLISTTFFLVNDLKVRLAPVLFPE